MNGIIRVSLILIISAMPLAAQVTDVAEKVGQALAAFGPVPVTTTIQVARQVVVCKDSLRDNPTIRSNSMPLANSLFAQGRDGYQGRPEHQTCSNQTVYDPKPQTTNQILAASNIRVINASTPTYGAVIRRELPDHIIPGDSLAMNCTPDPATPSFSVATSFQRTASIALSKSITHTTTAGMSVSAKFGDVFGATGSISFADGSTSGTVDTQGSAATVTETRSGAQSVPPHTFLMIELQTWPVHYTMPFNAVATIDADLSANDKGYKHLSDILNESQRTFPISGTLEAEDASSGALVFYDLPYDQSKCPAVSAPVFTKFTPTKKTKLTQRAASNK